MKIKVGRRTYYLRSWCGVAGEHKVVEWKTPQLAPRSIPAHRQDKA